MIRKELIRLPAVIAVAIAVNLVMFTAIQWMVVDRKLRLTDATDFDIANFIRMTEQSREVRSRRDPKAPEKPQQEAQQELSRLAQAARPSGVGGLSVDLPQIDIDVDIGGGIALARELTPLVRIPPEYPTSALNRRLEGYVVLQFTVTENGSVADPEILRSDPPKVFDRAAIRAVLRWKYQPQLVNGKPASVITYTRFKFELEKQR